MKPSTLMAYAVLVLPPRVPRSFTVPPGESACPAITPA